MKLRKERSLRALYLRNWLIPLVVFLASVCLSLALSAKLVDPVLRSGGDWIIIMLPPVCASIGIYYAYTINYQQKRDKVGAANGFSFVASLFIIILIGIGLTVAGWGG